MNVKYAVWKALLLPFHQTVMVPVRRHYYLYGRFRWLSKLPSKVKYHLGLDEPPLRTVRLEIGAGGRPQPGYLHLDMSRKGWHLEYVQNAAKLPFRDGSVDEIYASHVLEHVEVGRLLSTLQDWHRVLKPGGRLEVHVPHTAQIMQNFFRAAIPAKWAMLSALLGQRSANPHLGSPEQFLGLAQHQTVFDFQLLEWVLSQAGFCQVRDRTEELCDHHCEEWREVVPHLSLVVEARRSGNAKSATAVHTGQMEGSS